MAEDSWPAPTHLAGAVTSEEFEKLSQSGTVSGLVGDPSFTSLIFGDSSGMQVKIRADRRAQIRGHHWYSGASIVTKAISANSSGSTRIDRVVLRLDRSTWTVRVFVINGTPGAGAPAYLSDVGTTGSWDMPLALVTVTNGAATITAGNVVFAGWYLADDGGVQCRAATRPPAALVSIGTHAIETDTQRRYVRGATDWIDEVPQPVEVFQGANDSSGSVSYTGGTTHGTSFVAPPSGQVYVTFSGLVGSNATALRNCYMSVEIRTGGTVGSGTVVQAADDDCAIVYTAASSIAGFKYITASYRFLLAGLTAGSTYNAKTFFRTTNADSSAAVDNRRLLIEPVPW